ncbi:hypothetical protein KY290_007761 [Solanum tuberosum]|uniref:Retrotransposon Copia-like N-terminal domain-containing protein n=1 Tax=Solanum tuberosum TaxID=4113 RepID=A0ABQ7W6I1_SOLTU|nr:hypothetical protein KY290_007761 [Solanum tuberosum]
MANKDTIETIKKQHNHPLYLHQLDTPGSMLTSIPLTGVENYVVWSRSMILTLRAKSKLGFVYGTYKKSNYGADLEEQWEKCNAFVLSWILNFVSKELMSGIVYATDASVVWFDLKERFDKVDGSRGYQLHREICTIAQRDEFDALVPPPSCGCGKSKVYACDLHYEGQRMTVGSYSGVKMGESSTALYVGSTSSNKPSYQGNFHDGSTSLGSNNSGYPPASNSSSNVVGYNFQNGGSISNSQRHKRNYNLQCEVCKLKGHTKETCYRVVGYPPGHPKFRKKYGGTRMANAVDCDDAFSPFSAALRSQGMQDIHPMEQPVFTKEQYGQILRLLNKKKGTEDSAVNMTSIAHAYLVDNKVDYTYKQWIVDSGASKHITSDLGALFDIYASHKAIKSKFIYLMAKPPQFLILESINGMVGMS